MDVTSAPISQFAQIGRYQRSELEAMRGQRGRKPVEYFELFPKRGRPAGRSRTGNAEKTARVTASAAQAGSGDPLAERVRLATPRERLLLGHVLDALSIQQPLSPSEQIEFRPAAESAVPVPAPARSPGVRITRDLVVLPVGVILDHRS